VDIQLLAGETVLKRGKANKFTLINSQGGELVLTDKRLIFNGHGVTSAPTSSRFP